MAARLRLVVIADIGGENARHSGDEAMLEANLAGFRALLPDAAFTVVSREPAWIAASYGVEAVAPLGFSRDPSAHVERKALFDRLVAADTRGVQDQATLAAITTMDGLVISGGGNLSSTWPDLLYERAAFLRLAHAAAKPAVVLGQTIGPRLLPDQRQVLGDALATARFVGVRELHSAALALSLGVPTSRIWYQCDDALFLEGVPASLSAPARADPGPSIAVTIDPQIRGTRPDVFACLATQLRTLSEKTGASLILVPNAFGAESAGVPSDLTESRVLAERIALSGTAIAEGLDSGRVRQVAGEAALIISSRYHPIVFGLAAGVPSLGIHGDEYCRIKLQGALGHAQLEDWTLTYDDVAAGRLLPQALRLWQTRDVVRRALEAQRDAWHEEARERWAAVLHALDPARPAPPAAAATLFGRPLADVVPALVSAFAGRHEAWERDQAAFERLAARCEHTEAHARFLANELGPGRTARRYAAWALKRLGWRGLSG